MEKFRRLFKKSESEKINNEIMNTIYPLNAYENSQKLGYAQALWGLYEMAQKYIDNKYSEELDAIDLQKIIKELAGNDKVLNEYFYRLLNDK